MSKVSRGPMGIRSRTVVFACAALAFMVPAAAQAQVYIDQTTGSTVFPGSEPSRSQVGVGSVLYYMGDLKSVSPQVTDPLMSGLSETASQPDASWAISIQTGNRNAAAIDTTGAANAIHLMQKGDDNTAVQRQNGARNAASVGMFGNANAVGTTQTGDRNTANVTVVGGQNTVVTGQTGSDLSVSVLTIGNGKSVDIQQSR